MVEFKAFDKNVEVNGETVLSVVAGVGAFKSSALKILKDNNIDNPKPGQWYPQQNWLDAFKTISEKIGDHTLNAIGKAIPANAQWPPQVQDIKSALGSIDIAYHMNHRISGKPLFDPKTGKMTEGIGHYAFESTGDRSAKVTCENPYPCSFDKGIIEAAAKKFAKSGENVNVDEKSTKCRNNAGKNCVYIVTW
jgi:hypothetical protein